MERMICQCCGEALHKHGDVYECGYCGAAYRDDQAKKAADLLRGLLDDFKIEQLSNARRRLYETTHEKYPSSQAVTQAAGNVLSISPDDFMARVYLHSHDPDPHELISLLSRGNVSEWEAKETVDWLVRSLDFRAVGAVKDFADRHLKGNRKTEALNRIEDEAFKLDSGVYDLSLKRDVFLCYSTEDMPRVIEVMETFEENALTCFAAFRNLRHGKGAQENYQEAIFRAMRNCRVFVFLSSNSSRDPHRKGVAEELEHLISDLPKKPRVEFLLEDYPERMPILAKRRLEEAFPHLEYCREPNDLIVRVSGLLNAEENSERERARKIAEEAANQAREAAKAEFEAREAARKEELTRELEERLRIEKVEAVVDAIEAIGGVEYSPECKSRIDEAQRLYDALPEKAKALVLNHATLVSARAEYEKLKAEAEERERIKKEEDEAAKRINAIFDMKILPDGNASVAKCRDENITEAAIPESYRGRAVTSIGWGAFNGYKFLTSIAIPESVTSIGDFAFCECYSLSSIVIPNSVTSIGDSAFRGCSSLTSIAIPESVTSIGKEAFEGCSSLKSIAIPDSVTNVGEHAFRGCSSLKSIAIPNGVTYISKHAFNCSSLTSITIPNSVTTIGEFAFEGCSSLKSITIPESVTTIGDYAFSGCESLTSIAIPESVTSIGESAFSGCKSLTSITISNGVTSIGGSAFSGCSSLTSITIPESVTIIGASAFFHCESLKSIAIPESVTSIGKEAFWGCSLLAKNLWLGVDRMEYIPMTELREKLKIFDEAKPTDAIFDMEILPDGNASVAKCRDKDITETAIPERYREKAVTSIGEEAFRDCSSLKSITIPSSVTSIGKDAFSGCSCAIHFAHKKPLFGYPEGFSKECLKGFKGKAYWGGK